MKTSLRIEQSEGKLWEVFDTRLVAPDEDASQFNGFDEREKPMKRLGFSLDAGHPVNAGC